MQGRGFDLVFKSADDPTTSLYYFGEQIFSHIIHFAPKSSKLLLYQHAFNILKDCHRFGITSSIEQCAARQLCPKGR